MPTEYRKIQKHYVVEDLDSVHSPHSFPPLSPAFPAILFLINQSLTRAWDSSIYRKLLEGN